MFRSLRPLIVMATLMASVTGKADDNGRLYIIGDATHAEWNEYKAQALLSTPANPDVYTGTIHLNNTGEFKFMTLSEWGSPEFGAAPAVPVYPDIHHYRAPLYWSVYEYCYTREQQGNGNIDITPDEWDRIIDWVARDLKPYGYDMICTDGFISMTSNDATGYMTHYGSISLKDLIAKCKAKGLKLGVYDNPLWIHAGDGTRIEGTDHTFGDLKYNGSNQVVHPDASDKWFTWAVAENPGCKEFIDGFFKHYKELGVDYIRMDFLSWYEDGNDRGMGTVGRGYGRDSYALALSYIGEAAQKYGIFASLVMPHLFNDAELESKYGNMVRIVADTTTGGWWHCSEADRGRAFDSWPNCNNQFDGYTYWSHIAGRGKVILDGDFIRLNTFGSDAEKETEISLHLMAGGPVTVADQYHTIGDNVRFYQNTELLALNTDGFVGHPLSDSLNDPNNRIWYGQMSDGDYVIGLFNRDNSDCDIAVNLSDLGMSGEWKVRDLWRHADEGSVTNTLWARVPAHGCKIVRMSGGDQARNKVQVGEGQFDLATGTNDEGYHKLSVAEAGNYDITIDTSNLKGTIRRSPYQGSEIRHTSLFMVGSATPGGWDVNLGTPLSQSAMAPHIYSNTVSLKSGGSFKLATSIRGGGTFSNEHFFFRDANDDGKISTDGTDDRQWSVPKDGDYIVKVNTADNTIALSTSSAAIEITTSPDTLTPVYYNLQGQRVINPDKGMYIKVTGNKSEKIMMR